jgi:hypothetical protein
MIEETDQAMVENTNVTQIWVTNVQHVISKEF